MKTCTILCHPSTDQGTFGVLTTDSEEWPCLQLPWRDNQTGRSRIPNGTYRAVWHQSPSKGWVYLLTGTEPRSEILIHSANFAGDVDKDWDAQLLGCIALGTVVTALDNSKHVVQKAIGNSRIACMEFYEWGDKEDIEITISGDY